QGGSAVAVHQSVLGGVTIEGIGVENDPDDDGDGILDDAETDPDTDDDLTASLTTHGSAPTILIEADPANDLTLGAGASGYGLHVRGSVAAFGVYDGVEATAIRVAGDSGGSTATVDGGVAIDNVVSA